MFPTSGAVASKVCLNSRIYSFRANRSVNVFAMKILIMNFRVGVSRAWRKFKKYHTYCLIFFSQKKYVKQRQVRDGLRWSPTAINITEIERYLKMYDNDVYDPLIDRVTSGQTTVNLILLYIHHLLLWLRLL